MSTAPVNVAMISALASPLTTQATTVPAWRQSMYVAELSAALVRQGHAVTVYTRRADPDTAESVQTPQGYNVIHIPAGRPERLAEDELLRAMGPFALYLASAWSATGPDVTHAHFWMSAIATQLAARRLKLPTVLTFHGFGATPNRPPLESKLARSATCVSASCSAEAVKLIRAGRPRTGTSLIPDGVDVDVYTPDGPRAPRGRASRIVSAGKVLPHNGFDTVIRALPYIPDTEFVIVGDPDDSDRQADGEAGRLRALAEQLGVADRMRLYRPTSTADRPALLRSADVVMCTPSHESSGSVALEAMACGVPVVASAVGALLDVVVNEVTGRLIARDDPREIAAAVNSLVRNSFLRRSLGAAGRDRTVARYKWDRVAADTARLYHAAISAGARMAASF